MNTTRFPAPSKSSVASAEVSPKLLTPPGFDLAFHSVLLTITFLIILTNGLVFVFFRVGKLGRVKSNYLLLSLSFSDMATGVIAIPLNIFCESTIIWSACLASFETNRFIGISTISHILVLTLEKYLAVMYPMLHRRVVTKRNVTVVVATMWLLSLLITLIPLEWLLDLGGVRSGFSPSGRKKQTIHETFIFVVFFVFPLATMFACYARMLSLIVMHSFSALGKQAKESTPRNVSRYRRFKPMVLFLVMLLTFIFSWGWWFFGTIQRANNIPVAIPDVARSILVFFRYCSSFLNPLLYTFFKRDFKLAFKQLVLRCFVSAPSAVHVNMHVDNKVSPQPIKPLEVKEQEVDFN